MKNVNQKTFADAANPQLNQSRNCFQQFPETKIFNKYQTFSKITAITTNYLVLPSPLLVPTDIAA